MTTNLIQASFAAGEFAPSLHARVDLAKYRIGAAVVRNFIVDYRGGVMSRPGTHFVGISATKTSGPPPRIIRFQFGSEPTAFGPQNYVLEFGEGYIGFIKAGAVVTNTDGSPYTIVSPYAARDLPWLKFDQSADVMTLCCVGGGADYQPMQLKRFADTNWTLTPVDFTARQEPPTNLVAVCNSPQAFDTTTHVLGPAPFASGDLNLTIYRYAVSAVNKDTGEESPHQQLVQTSNAGRIMSADGNAFVTLTWDAAPGADSYRIYRQMEVPNSAPPFDSLYGLIGRTTGLSYVDRDGVPDYSKNPPEDKNPFADSTWPVCCTYYVQRHWFGGSRQKPETFWASQVGAFNNMSASIIPQADDAITATLAATEVNAIQHMTPMPTGIIAATSGRFWLISGGGVNAGNIPTPITPDSMVAQAQSANGCSAILPPLVVGPDVFYVQSKGAVVRSLTYNYFVNIYEPKDMTVLANHLFVGRDLREWAYAEEPFKVFWAVRDDGILLSFTYLKEQEVAAWARHDTDGLFQSVCTVSEGNVDAAYFVVKRFLGGAGEAGGDFTGDQTGGAPAGQLGGHDTTPGGSGSTTGPTQSTLPHLKFDSSKTDPGIVLSDGDLTVTGAHPSQDAITQTDLKLPRLRYYFEFQVVHLDALYLAIVLTTVDMFGGTAAYDILNADVHGTNGLRSVIWYRTGSLWADGEGIGGGPSMIQGRWYGVAVDQVNLKIWVRDITMNGGWNEITSVQADATPNPGVLSDDPANLRGGFDWSNAGYISTRAGVGVILPRYDNGTILKFNFGQLAYQATPPAGYNNAAADGAPPVGAGGTTAGAWVYTIERLSENIRLEGNIPLGIDAPIENAWCLDCAAALPQPRPAANLFPWAPAGGRGETATFYADAPVFDAGHVGNVLRGYGGGKAVVTEFLDAQHVRAAVVLPFPTIPNYPDQQPLPIAQSYWNLTAPVTTLSGLEYLEGRVVGILADGETQPQQVVNNGQVTLAKPASQILVGLPYQCQLQTLRLEAGEPTIQGKRKKINAVTARVRATAPALKAGRTWETLRPVRFDGDGVMLRDGLVTGDMRINLDARYDCAGQVCFQLDDPAPATLLGVIGELTGGDSP